MTIWVLTLFPEMFAWMDSQSILKRAKQKNLLNIKTLNIRDFASDKRRTVDDKPYGGGLGMILKVDIVVKTLESIKPKPYIILLSASGQKYTQKVAQALSKKRALALICGHYEGVDARVESFVDQILSIGDFVLTGGEIASMAVIDSVARLIPGVIKGESTEIESFSATPSGEILEYPQYTKPREFRGRKVPKILLSGNHHQILKWRLAQANTRTKRLRPDLISKFKRVN